VKSLPPRTSIVAWFVLLPGCTVDETALPPAPPVASCEALELTLPDGSCVRPGMRPDDCAEGFVHDGEYGCVPTLPSEACSAGMMAVPGESACRPVMPCAEGTWGDIPIEPSTEHVDRAYTGGSSDGSAMHPWTTISDAIEAAADGAIVAIARGRYTESPYVYQKRVRLWGVCPDEVSVSAPRTQADLAGLIVDGGHGTEVHALALDGGAVGLGVASSENVLADRLWVHDQSGWGILVEDILDPTSLTLVDSLVERATEIGVGVTRADLNVEASVVRAVRPRPSDQSGGRGIHAQVRCSSTGCDASNRATLRVRRSLVQDNHEVGISVMSSDASIEGTVVMGTRPRPSGLIMGRGLVVQFACAAEGNCDAGARSIAHLAGSMIEGNHDSGVLVVASSIDIETTVVRGTQPRLADGAFGRGIGVQDCSADAECLSDVPAHATLKRSLVEKNHEFGLMFGGVEASLDGVVVRDTLPDASTATWGRGIHIQRHAATGTRSRLDLIGSLIERNHELGVYVFATDARIESTVVRATEPRELDGRFGDGLAAYGDAEQATVEVVRTQIKNSARAGLANFGTFVALSGVAIECAKFDLEGEHTVTPEEVFKFVLEDRGGNRCGCPDADVECVYVSTGIEAPEPLVELP
jgi:hypothetical protein